MASVSLLQGLLRIVNSTNLLLHHSFRHIFTLMMEILFSFSKWNNIPLLLLSKSAKCQL